MRTGDNPKKGKKAKIVKATKEKQLMTYKN